MSSSPLPSPPSAPAPAAFLRGIERRAAVLAELQAGDAIAGDAAVAAAMRQWHLGAGDLALGAWSGRFWSLLLAQPQLRTRTAVAMPLDATDRLGELGAGPRAALLLRLAAGLDEATAAAALGVAAPSYRLALQRALPRQSDGSPDALSWQRLRDQVQHRIKALPPERLQRLAGARATLPLATGPAAAPVAAGDARTHGRRRSPPVIGLWVLLALCALALAATFLPAAPGWLGHDQIDPAGSARVLRERPAASHYGQEAGLVAHRDFALLADPAADQAHDLAFHSWLAMQSTVLAGTADPAARVPVADGSDGSAAQRLPGSYPDHVESDDAPD